jgi:K+-sensing histidine kinase KdpD/DNA-binding winged helix-turn-helix (wHTH) protein
MRTMVLGDSETTRPISVVGGFVVAAAMVAAVTGIGLATAARWGNAPVVLLFIAPVLVTAVYAGLWPALLAAVAATLAFDYFFTEPFYTLTIESPADMVTVLILLLVAVVTSQLAGSVREQARLAAAHAARNATIAGLARRLLSCIDEPAIATITVGEVARLFDCRAVLVAGAEEPRVVAGTPADSDLSPADLATAALTLRDGVRAGRGVQRIHLVDWQFHPVASDRSVLAAVGLAREDGVPPVGDAELPLLENLLDQAALALERIRLEQKEREAASLRERDELRSALLASIGEDVKPRLTAISAAARALRREGAADKAQVATVAAEAAMLDRYIDNLIDLGPGADHKPARFGPITLDLYRRAVFRDGEAVHLAPKEYALLAELAKHAGRVLTHEYLLRAVWGPAHEDHIDYLRVAVRALRQKLEEDPARPALILNEPAVGYRLAMPEP